jgi:hypothetical protein
MAAMAEPVRVVTLSADEFRVLISEAVAGALEAIGPTGQAPALLDRAGLARAFDVSLATLDRLRAEGCPELRLGDAPRFELSEVLGWLRDRRRSAIQADAHRSENAAKQLGSSSSGWSSGTPVLAQGQKRRKNGACVLGSKRAPVGTREDT